ncbi:WD repeat-containing protein 27 isoform X2 [Erpetoichthys calabaricus]|uniref:WD repeat-containing protein 27 isoform X2 n=1 Tax=Erpetoichthys calabaricus TaxID=27687 RepID=UPI0022346524|nr:WD repeat-containing protein 27 isoform X2 [Erpetoichthys calabaricus]
MEGIPNSQLNDDGFNHSIFKEKYCVSSSVSTSHIQVACSSCYCAFPLHGNLLCILKAIDLSPQPLLLKGHHQHITAIAFGNLQTPMTVCSASEDYVIIWDIERCHMQALNGVLPRGIVIGTRLGHIQHLSFCPGDQVVAACADSKIILLSSAQEEILSVLEGHTSSVTAAEFCSWQPEILVSVSEDRTFKVWNQMSGELLYKSSILSASPLLSLCIHEESRQLIVGSGNGQVWIFSLIDGHYYRVIKEINLLKSEQKFLKSVETLQAQNGQPGELRFSTNINEDEEIIETSKSILRITPCSSSSLSEDAHSFLSNSLNSVWIGSADGLYIINLDTSELEIALYFTDFPGLSIIVAGSCAVHHGTTNNVFTVITSMFENKISLLELNLSAVTKKLHSLKSQACCMEECLAVVARIPLLGSSPLNSELFKKEASKSAKQKNSGHIKSSVKDKPLVFHAKVKSSGYTTKPRMSMFSPKTNMPKQFDSSLKEHHTSLIAKEYPVDCPVPNAFQKQVNVADRPTPIFSLQYSGNGKHLACGLADKSILLYNSSLSGSPAVYAGHNGALCSVAWSHNNQLLLSASEDRTYRIWQVNRSEPTLVLSSEVFPSPIRLAQFYYMDKFLLLSSGPSLQLFMYHLDTLTDDIKRYKKKSFCRLAEKFLMTSGTEITSFSAVNEFYSYIALCSGCDHSVEVFDLNVARSIAVIPDAHCRAAHQIIQNKGSSFSTQQSEAYNLFLTTAVTEGIKLWDLRTLRCVRRFDGHHNRCHPCGISISPCGKYIATGSENKCAYVFDIRCSNFLNKLSRCTDTVMQVAFNPSKPQLVTATLDGKIQQFRA